MFKSLVLYAGYFVALLLGALVPGLSWLSPVGILFLLVGTLWLWRSAGQPLSGLGFRRGGLWRRYVAYGIVLGFAIPLAAVALQVGVGWLELEPAARSASQLVRPLLLGVVRLLFVVAMEELVFRGYYLQRLQPRLSLWPAALLSSLLWALSHLPNMIASGLSVVQLVLGMLTFVLWGAVLALSFLSTGKTLWLPFSLHFGTNLGFSLLGTFWAKAYLASAWLVGHPAWAPESGLVGVAVWGILLLAAWRMARHHRPDSHHSRITSGK